MTHAWKMHRPLDNGAFHFSSEDLDHQGGPGFFLAAEDGRGPALTSAAIPRVLRRWPDLQPLDFLVRACGDASYIYATDDDLLRRRAATAEIRRRLGQLGCHLAATPENNRPTPDVGQNSDSSRSGRGWIAQLLDRIGGR